MPSPYTVCQRCFAVIPTQYINNHAIWHVNIGDMKPLGLKQYTPTSEDLKNSLAGSASDVDESRFSR